MPMKLKGRLAEALIRVERDLAILNGVGYFTREEWIQLDGIIHKGEYLFTDGPGHESSTASNSPIRELVKGMSDRVLRLSNDSEDLLMLDDDDVSLSLNSTAFDRDSSLDYGENSQVRGESNNPVSDDIQSRTTGKEPESASVTLPKSLDTLASAGAQARDGVEAQSGWNTPPRSSGTPVSDVTRARVKLPGGSQARAVGDPKSGWITPPKSSGTPVSEDNRPRVTIPQAASTTPSESRKSTIEGIQKSTAQRIETNGKGNIPAGPKNTIPMPPLLSKYDPQISRPFYDGEEVNIKMEAYKPNNTQPSRFNPCLQMQKGDTIQLRRFLCGHKFYATNLRTRETGNVHEEVFFNEPWSKVVPVLENYRKQLAAQQNAERAQREAVVSGQQNHQNSPFSGNGSPKRWDDNGLNTSKQQYKWPLRDNNEFFNRDKKAGPSSEASEAKSSGKRRSIPNQYSHSNTGSMAGNSRNGFRSQPNSGDLSSTAVGNGDGDNLNVVW